ncbi:MAG: hypothetical protein OQK32_06965 [Gammaproteobacteria bacterium]|nr:hypothetical protein [Gammaproteobacteria bacterium]
MKRKLLLNLLGLFLLGGVASAKYYRTYAIYYDSTTVKSDMYLDGNYYLFNSTTALTDVADNGADPLTYADVAFESGGTYPLKLYNGDLKVVTIGYGITFPDGSLQTTAGVGSAFNTLSSTGTIVINSDSDASGNEDILFRTNGATLNMEIDGASGHLKVQDTIRDLSESQIMISRDSINDILRIGGGLSTCKTVLYGGASERVRVSSYSAVGIGTTTPLPASILDVNGKLYLESSAYLNYDNSNYEIDISTDINVNGNVNIDKRIISKLSGIPLFNRTFGLDYVNRKVSVEAEYDIPSIAGEIISVGDFIYSVNNTLDVINKINNDGVIVSTVTLATGANPNRLLYDGTYLWVSDDTADILNKINIDTDVIISTITVGQNPTGMAFDGTYVWVQNRSDANINKINPATDAIVSTITLAGVNNYDLVYDGEYMWSGGALGALKIDISSDIIIATATITAIGTIKYMTFDGSSIWLSGSNGYVSKVDVVSVKEIGVVDLNSVFTSFSSSDLCFDGAYIWVISSISLDDSFARIDIDSLAITSFYDEVLSGSGSNTGIVCDIKNVWMAKNDGANSYLRKYNIN